MNVLVLVLQHLDRCSVIEQVIQLRPVHLKEAGRESLSGGHVQ